MQNPVQICKFNPKLELEFTQRTKWFRSVKFAFSDFQSQTVIMWILQLHYKRRYWTQTDSDKRLGRKSTTLQHIWLHILLWDSDGIKITTPKCLACRICTLITRQRSISFFFQLQSGLIVMGSGANFIRRCMHDVVSDSAVGHYRDHGPVGPVNRPWSISQSSKFGQSIKCKAHEAVECKAQADHEAQALLQFNTQLLES